MWGKTRMENPPAGFDTWGQFDLFMAVNRKAPSAGRKKGIAGKAVLGIAMAGAAALMGVGAFGYFGASGKKENPGEYYEIGLVPEDSGSSAAKRAESAETCGRAFEKLEKQVRDAPVSYRTDDFSEDAEEVLLARMIFGEARNCSGTEKAAVAYTALNRVNDGKKWNGTTLREVVLCRFQYSCFNEGDPNRRKLMDPERYDKDAFAGCLDIAGRVLSGEIADPTGGATHYFNPGRASPSWASKLRKIGRIRTESGQSRHEFYSSMPADEKQEAPAGSD